MKIKDWSQDLEKNKAIENRRRKERKKDLVVNSVARTRTSKKTSK